MADAWKVVAPHYDEVKALEMIRQGVNPSTAYQQCLVETVETEMDYKLTAMLLASEGTDNSLKSLYHRFIENKETGNLQTQDIK